MKKADFEKMLEKDKNKTLTRLALLNTNIDNRCPDTGFVKIAPRANGRIVCLGDPIEHVG